MAFLPNPETMAYTHVVKSYEHNSKPNRVLTKQEAVAAQYDPGRGCPPCLTISEVSAGNVDNAKQVSIVSLDERLREMRRYQNDSWRIILGGERDRRTVLRDVYVLVREV